MLLGGNAIGELTLIDTTVEATPGRLEYSLPRTVVDWTLPHSLLLFTVPRNLLEWTMASDWTFAPELPVVAAGTTQDATVDCGDTTAGLETGFLRAGTEVVSVSPSVYAKPTGAADPTLADWQVNEAAVYCNGRLCAIGEAVQGRVTVASDQAAGLYTLKIVCTLDSGEVIPRFLSFEVR